LSNSAKKLWDKGGTINEKIGKFTVGSDRDLDCLLAPYDILGSIAHITMLNKIDLLMTDELTALKSELISLYRKAENNSIKIDEGVEDIHSQIEILLTDKLGETGKKIHSGRSRNDQILVDIKLYIRDQIKTTVELTKKLFDILIELSEKYSDIFMPGYTHMQIAMPSSFGLWFGAFAESLADDLIMMQSAYRIVNKNPLGSAAGYGSSFPLDRTLTTRLLGFDDLHYNSIYAQMNRGKTERIVSQALSVIASTLSKLAMDITLYMNQNFGFISFPDELTTGSSIMPHKKNPDVFELIRARCNRIQSLPGEITLITANLPSGYHRDLQMIKEHFIRGFDDLNDSLEIMTYMLRQIQINKNILVDPVYDNLFSVEAINKLVIEGVPFREAYRKIGQQIKDGTLKINKQIKHTHEGSIGNLCNNEISERMANVISGFNFKTYENAIRVLLKE
jgi:argininosuccinate lyase